MGRLRTMSLLPDHRYRNRCSREHEKLRTKAREIDEWFYSLNEWSQRTILIHMIGYLEASKDLISSGRQVQPDGISRAFSIMEDMINEA